MNRSWVFSAPKSCLLLSGAEIRRLRGVAPWKFPRPKARLGSGARLRLRRVRALGPQPAPGPERPLHPRRDSDAEGSGFFLRCFFFFFFFFLVFVFFFFKIRGRQGVNFNKGPTWWTSVGGIYVQAFFFRLPFEAHGHISAYDFWGDSLRLFWSELQS